MSVFTLHCHRPGRAIPAHCFFILSRGKNTGRPAYSPNTNCFVFSCSPEQVALYFWLVTALWQSRAFYPYLCGSCVEFIHLRHLRKVIQDGEVHLSKLETYTEALQKIQAIETTLHRQLTLIKVARQGLWASITRPVKTTVQPEPVG